MKKQELVHLHGLLKEVRDFSKEQGEAIETERYDDLGIEPTSIHKSKTVHKEAVFKLAKGINGTHGQEVELSGEDSLEDVPDNLREPYLRFREEVNPWLKRDNSDETWYFDLREKSEERSQETRGGLNSVLRSLEQSELDELENAGLIEKESGLVESDRGYRAEHRVYLTETKAGSTDYKSQAAESV